MSTDSTPLSYGVTVGSTSVAAASVLVVAVGDSVVVVVAAVYVAAEILVGIEKGLKSVSAYFLFIELFCLDGFGNCFH